MSVYMYILVHTHVKECVCMYACVHGNEVSLRDEELGDPLQAEDVGISGFYTVNIPGG